jgi:DNA-binding GntR family transcriptional regulator
MSKPLLDRRTLREQLAGHLRKEIANGVLKPGAPLVEANLSTRFGVSRGTVREVLRELHEQQFVVHHQRRGTFVHEVTPKEVLEIYEVRAALEGRAASAIAISGERLHRIVLLEAKISEMHASAGLSFRERVEADIGFHRELCLLSQNETLLLTWERLVGRIAAVHSCIPEPLISPLMSPDDHMLVVDAIRSENIAAISRTLNDFMAHAAAQVVAAMNQQCSSTVSFKTRAQ